MHSNLKSVSLDSMGKIPKGAEKIYFPMLYGWHCHIFLGIIPQKVFSCDVPLSWPSSSSSSSSSVARWRSSSSDSRWRWISQSPSPDLKSIQPTVIQILPYQNILIVYLRFSIYGNFVVIGSLIEIATIIVTLLLRRWSTSWVCNFFCNIFRFLFNFREWLGVAEIIDSDGQENVQ